MKSVIIAARAHNLLADTLKQHGFDVISRPGISYDELFKIIAGASGLVVSTGVRIDRSMIEQGIKLEWIGRLGSGMEHIDTGFALSRNIECVSSPEGNRKAVAEHALGMLLCISKNICHSWQQVKQGFWLREENRGFELGGKTIGIIGFGNTGSAFAALLSSFDARIIAHDKYKTGFGNTKVEEVTLDELLSRSDVISIHLPMTDETVSYVNTAFLQKTEKKPIIINTSRGKIVDIPGLIKALESGGIGGVALDVLPNEVPDSFNEAEKTEMHFLLNHPRVLITPHIAGYSNESSLKMSEILLQKLGFQKR